MVLLKLLPKTFYVHFWAIVLSILFISYDAEATVVKLAWDAPASTSGISGYNIYYKLTSSSTYSLLGTTSSLSFSYNSTAITPGTYDFIVRSKNSSNQESVDSNKATSTLFSLPITLQRVGSASANKIANYSVTSKLFNIGTSTPQLSVSITAPDASGIVWGYSLSGALAANLDVLVDAAGHLAKRASSRSVTSTAALPAMLSGDVNGDGVVNGSDVSKMLDAAHWGQPGGASNPESDFNADGITNGSDVSALLPNFNQVSDQ